MRPILGGLLAIAICAAAWAATPDSLLLVAQIKKGDVAQLNAFLSAHPGVVRQLSPTGTPPLVTAVSLKSDPGVIGALVQAGAEPNQPNTRGTRPLLLAISSQEVALVEALLSYKANPNLISQKGTTALHAAVVGKDKTKAVQIVQLLIKAGAKPDLADKKGRTPLCEAVFACAKDDAAGASLVQALVAGGAKPNQKIALGDQQSSLADVAKGLKMPLTAAALSQ